MRRCPHKFTAVFPRFTTPSRTSVALRFTTIQRIHKVHSIETNHTNSGANHMDFFNTFLAFNVAATALTLVAFFAMREPIAAYAETAKEKFANFNVAGTAGAATSFVLLASVANLFI
jgi:hypothetical protein